MKNNQGTRAFLAVLLATTALTACESSVDVARKPALVEALVQESVKTCEPNEKTVDALRTIFSQISSQRLDVLKEDKVTVCLDQRLITQKDDEAKGVRRIYSVFYPDDKVISLIPPEYPKSTDGYDEVFKGFTKGRFSLILQIEKIVENKSSLDNPSLSNEFMYAGHYRGCAGKCTHLEVKTASEFDQASIIANPELKTAPLKNKAIKRTH